MVPELDSIQILPRTARRNAPSRWRQLAVFALPAVLLASLAFVCLRSYVAQLGYRPREGDVVFQSLTENRVVSAIEGATGSPLSHCGLVAKRDGRWIVIEAYQGVEETPLSTWLARGRGGGFVACRLRPPNDQQIPEMIVQARRMLGRPYDRRYRWDDEQIYCSELIAKAFEQAAGRPFGRRVRLGELQWQPYRRTIEQIEGGPVPLDRELLTPRDLAAAPELIEVARYGL